MTGSFGGPLRLVVFDVDGTLIDSQNHIFASMERAFAAVELEVPRREDVLSIVGLSLDHAVAQLAPDQPVSVQNQIVEGYKSAFADLRAGGVTPSPLFSGARSALDEIYAKPEWLLGVATGKSRRGLNALFDSHDLHPLFETTQVADAHPSKPHPAMLQAALAQTGVEPQNAVMIGDTRFDMDMAQAAGVPFVGVDWGYHAARTLTQGIATLSDFSELMPLLTSRWSQSG